MREKATYFTPISFHHRVRTLYFFGDFLAIKLERKKKLHLSLIHTSSSQSLNREESQWSEKLLGRIVIFGVIMFTISEGFAVISATKNLKLPFMEDVFASGSTRFLEWVVSENQNVLN
ncbi:hypothetical protein Prudu_015688 [Prunus dulcis]|uniref:Uncharacterized protein n=1 Tax=Prunus dulcis TaxID=3755 RepID=A0A4Y1RLJ2_PRUDU|nr:hypothetical protein Prudu_015688 [Prunus dulcis]